MKKFLKFFLISLVLFIFFLVTGRFISNIVWHRDILDAKTYKTLSDYWNNGGNFSSPKYMSFFIFMLMLLISWIVSSIKLYKYGVIKFLTNPIIVIYRKLTTPKNLEVEHVSIKNLGSKSKTLDEIISEKVKEKSVNSNSSNTNVSSNLRKEISAKLREN